MHVIKRLLSLFSEKTVKQVTGDADRKECVPDVFTVIFFWGGGGDFLEPDPLRHADIMFM